MTSKRYSVQRLISQSRWLTSVIDQSRVRPSNPPIYRRLRQHPSSASPSCPGHRGTVPVRRPSRCRSLVGGRLTIVVGRR